VHIELDAQHHSVKRQGLMTTSKDQLSSRIGSQTRGWQGNRMRLTTQVCQDSGKAALSEPPAHLLQGIKALLHATLLNLASNLASLSF
jgi:hypothetical protein